MRLVGPRDLDYPRWRSRLAWRSVLPDTREANAEITKRNVRTDIGRLNKKYGKGSNDTGLRGHNIGHPPRRSICEQRANVGCDGATDVGRNGQQLSVGGGEAHTLHDARHREFKGVVRHRVRPAHEGEQVHLPVKHHREYESPVEALFVGVSGDMDLSGDLAQLEIADFVGGQPSCCKGRGICQDKDTEGPDDDCHESLDDKYLQENTSNNQTNTRKGVMGFKGLTHRHPSYPPRPSIFAKPNARIPENAPPVAADV